MGNPSEGSLDFGFQLGEVLLSISREMRMVAGLPENARVRACASRGGLLCRVLVRDATRAGCRPCLSFAMVLCLLPRASTQASP